jgi:hypothetical protein
MPWISGKELQIGDTIEVWWTPGRDTVTTLRPYSGPLANLFPDGAQIAGFALLGTGMTIDNAERFLRISPRTREA